MKWQWIAISVITEMLNSVLSTASRESNRLKYRSGSGSRLFKNLGSVRVQLHQNLKVRVRFGFIATKVLRFRFGSGSPKKSGFSGSRFRFGFSSKSLI